MSRIREKKYERETAMFFPWYWLLAMSSLGVEKGLEDL